MAADAARQNVHGHDLHVQSQRFSIMSPQPPKLAAFHNNSPKTTDRVYNTPLRAVFHSAFRTLCLYRFVQALLMNRVRGKNSQRAYAMVAEPCIDRVSSYNAA